MPELVTQHELNSLLDIVVECVECKSLEKIRDASKKFGQLIGADKLYWAVPVFGNNGTFVPAPVIDLMSVILLSGSSSTRAKNW